MLKLPLEILCRNFWTAPLLPGALQFTLPNSFAVCQVCPLAEINVCGKRARPKHEAGSNLQSRKQPSEAPMALHNLTVSLIPTCDR